MMQVEKPEIVQRTARVLLKVFGEFLEGTQEEKLERILKNLHTGEEDPGGWSRSAAVVIHAECIPLPVPAEIPMIERWCRVSDELEGYFCEHVNYAVATIYPL